MLPKFGGHEFYGSKDVNAYHLLHDYLGKG